ncbi:preprotein translocase subunit YajC [Solemya pervernicosa gill symbiont]|uniref:Sec translocon accessory complex subunit YajC n=2 Tax=Gammaproteobacteria incertae sedis TaxID=118884 RepID=A0A1T2LAP5_9GAMM|nr:preprotein translocase subunit YajC [Candidatus Reidiella endopervernicosa]OOZ42178.1 preprotein translocase subunit YajC [Solemya pervernicosa gill symbiont]QKQ27253.1 preprotein translocase subunit YajC [Candidatus Reidiella endopervernicosa]
MSFFISDAMAEAAPAAQAGDSLMGILPLVLIFVVFYFLLIRPQSKRAKEHKAMVEALTKGDEVVTNGGVLGKITEVGDTFAKIEIAKGIEVHVQRGAVGTLMPKGTIKNL